MNSQISIHNYVSSPQLVIWLWQKEVFMRRIPVDDTPCFECSYYPICNNSECITSAKDCNECKVRCCTCDADCEQCHLPCDNRRADYYNASRFIHWPTCIYCRSCLLVPFSKEFGACLFYVCKFLNFISFFDFIGLQ